MCLMSSVCLCLVLCYSSGLPIDAPLPLTKPVPVWNSKVVNSKSAKRANSIAWKTALLGKQHAAKLFRWDSERQLSRQATPGRSCCLICCDQDLSLGLQHVHACSEFHGAIELYKTRCRDATRDHNIASWAVRQPDWFGVLEKGEAFCYTEVCFCNQMQLTILMFCCCSYVKSMESTRTEF